MGIIRKWRGVDQMHFFRSEALNVQYLEAAVGRGHVNGISSRGVIVTGRAHKGDIGRGAGLVFNGGVSALFSTTLSQLYSAPRGKQTPLFIPIHLSLTSHCSLRRKDMKGGIADRCLMDFNHSFNHFLILANS
jgi:hypothetical protein